MIDISEEVRKLYKTDRYPLHEEPITKDLYIKVLETGTVITESGLETESFSLEESICSASEIVFGSCEASVVSFTVYNIPEDLSGKTIRIWQTINGHDVPFGTYRVDTVTKKDGNADWKEVTAYDRMTELDRDATSWFAQFWSARSKSTIKEFRTAFFQFMGFDIVEQELANDHMEITKTIDPEFIKGRYIAQKIGEINACFGHFTRENKFKYISIGALALYPSETLYPAEDLFPSESTEMMEGDRAVYFADESRYEDYYVRPIDSVQIKAPDGSEGVTAGKENKNTYIIHSNFFVYDKTDEQIKEIAENFLNMVKNKFYIPNNTHMIGLPYLEVGDTVAIILEKDAVESFVFQRKLTGMQSLEDEITAQGNEYRKNEADEGSELMQLKAKVEDAVSEVAADTDKKLDDLSNGVDSKFEEVNGDIININNKVGDLNISLQQTNDGLLAEITRAKGEEAKLSSTISMTVNEIKLAVSETYQTKTDAESKYAALSSEIKLTAQDITSTVSATYETKSGANSSYANLSSQIVQSANSIQSTVAATYETKSDAGNYYQSFQSQITQTANQISTKVSAGEVESLIEQNADSIRMKAGAIVIDSTYFKVNSSGYATMTGGEIGDFTLADGVLSGQSLKINGYQLECNFITPYSYSRPIEMAGDVQVDGKLTVSQGVQMNSSLTATSNVYFPGVYGNSTTADPNLHITKTGYLNTKGGSSRRWKHDIRSIQDAEIDAHRLYNVRPRQFVYNDGYIAKDDWRANKSIPGFIIEELQEDYPIAVEYDEFGNPASWGSSFFIAPIVQLLQEHKRKMDSMQMQLMSAVNQITVLNIRMGELVNA